ncbi:MAG: hypothetical protein NTX59_03290 [Elusimicrobia bacterium]|nr:hypothetical protein [Elusimicrobiota bacterium]
MDIKTIRVLIYFFLAVIAAFTFFIFLNAVGARAPAGADALAQSAMANAQYSFSQKEALPVPVAQHFSSSSVRAEGAIMIVRESKFQGVAEPPKSGMEMLNEMSGANRNKIQPIALEDSDLERKIVPLEEQSKAPGLAGSSVPALGKAPKGGLAMIKAPAGYELFTSSETWAAFAGSHKCDPVKADFLKENVLILVSLSDFPSGIFKITALKNEKKELVVRYKVDPFAMSVSNKEGTQQAYSAIPVPKSGRQVRLEQVP